MIRLLLTILIAFTATLATRAAPPNVILVITDDQGYGDLACHGNPKLKTPHLDALHAESTRLTDFHVSPTCSPTRSALMSGHDANRTGVWHTIMGRSMLRQGEATLGEVFRDSGYATGHFGKWHLGDNYPFRPEDRGFTEVVRHGGGGVGQTPDFWNNSYFDDTYFHNGKPTEYQGFCTDVFFREAKRFIKASAAENKPFFAYISTNAPHGPWHCPEEYSRPYLEQGLDQTTAVFFGMIANIDDNVGSLRKWLRDHDLADNTIFIFLTDNGSARGSAVFNAGMRGAKGSEYEGGHRVPCFFHWPAGGLDQPVDIGELCAGYDILPTLIDLCQLEAPKDYRFDGVSLADLIRGRSGQLAERVVISDSQRVLDPIKWRKSSTMSGPWRLINGTNLYNIETDPGQNKDIADQHPGMVTRLRAAYEAWWADLEPTFEIDARMIVGHPAENPARLTAHDWLTTKGAPPWNQSAIRQGRLSNGKWAIHVHEAGKYRIALRRWPVETGAALRAALPPGDPVPGGRAYRQTPGKALPIVAARLLSGDIEREIEVSTDDAEAVFEVTLPKGDRDLQGEFILDDQQRVGSYYVSLEKL